MLNCLRIRNLAIVPELDVEFGSGLVVVTGETGAGKSILVNALKLVLGGRGRPELVRSGSDQAEVEALFELRGPEDRARLDGLGLPADDELVVRRVLHSSGRSRAFVNGRLVTATQLQHLTAGLVDISSQHEHQSLSDPTTHMTALDSFGGLGGLRDQIGSFHGELVRWVDTLRVERARIAERSSREDLLLYQVGEIDKIRPVEGEEDAIAEEVGRLRHAGKLRQISTAAEEALWSGDGAIDGMLGRVAGEVRDASHVDPSLGNLAVRLDQARGELEDIARELSRYSRRIEADPARLGEAEERLHQLRRLVRKYGGSILAVIEHRRTIGAELAAFDNLGSHIDTLEQQLIGLREKAGAVARELSTKRHEQAALLSAAITHELTTLGMGGARVEVAVAPIEGASTDLDVNGARLAVTGIDRVEFLIAPNRGEDPRPLRKVASGGELSRALLALKRVLAGIGPVGTYIFDEVDTGVGGAIAEVIGHKLRDVARHHQVICITHLPQVAALGDRHLRVRKFEVDGRTVSAITPLSNDERVDELARMLGGLRITEATRRAAAEMLAGV